MGKIVTVTFFCDKCQENIPGAEDVYATLHIYGEKEPLIHLCQGCTDSLLVELKKK